MIEAGPLEGEQQSARRFGVIPFWTHYLVFPWCKDEDERRRDQNGENHEHFPPILDGL
jgi:hypothetical protein